jgi:anti-sigma B factor antagonist
MAEELLKGDRVRPCCGNGGGDGEAIVLPRLLGRVEPSVNRENAASASAPSSFRICLMPQLDGSDCLAKSAVVAVGGEVDLATSPEMHRVLSEALRSGAVDMVIDLRAVDFMDASGIGVLVEIASSARAGGGRVLLRRPSRRVLRVLDLLQLEDVLPLESASEPPSWV